MGGTCEHCHNYLDSIHYTNDYGEICNDCSLEITRPYISETENEDGTYTIELDPEVVEKLEVLIDERERQEEEEEETKDWPDWHNGIEFPNILPLSQDRTNCKRSLASSTYGLHI